MTAPAALLATAHWDPAVPGLLLAMLGLTVLAALYFLPTGVALLRKVPNVGSVVVVNVFFGWTFIGWVVALALAARSVPPSSLPPAPPAEYGSSSDHRNGGGAVAVH